MFTAVLQLHGIAPKFPTIARGSSSVSQTSNLSQTASEILRRADYLRRPNFYFALVRLSCWQIRVRSYVFEKEFYAYLA